MALISNNMTLLLSVLCVVSLIVLYLTCRIFRKNNNQELYLPSIEKYQSAEEDRIIFNYDNKIHAIEKARLTNNEEDFNYLTGGKSRN